MSKIMVLNQQWSICDKYYSTAGIPGLPGSAHDKSIV
jgi:hypothetical protein